MNNKKLLFFIHGGSGNRGCEAIVRSVAKITNFIDKNNKIVFTNKINEDLKFALNSEVRLMETSTSFNNRLLSYIKYFICGISYKFGNGYFQTQILNANILKQLQPDSLAITIGGDVYCYGKPYIYYHLNNSAKRKSMKSIFWGCSIEPKDMDDEMVLDLKKYDLIIARESITYNALLDKKINRNTKLYPDPAFQLDRVELPLPPGFVEGNTIGINLSPLVINCESIKGAALDNYTCLLQHIIDTTDMQIALIPHVTWKTGNDMEPLKILYEKFKDTGRIILIGDQYNCMELKGFISRCRMFIGARTHATIAAYSSCVPTLVVGYSVKALGIARDIFGSEKNMVIPVQTLESKDDLIKVFQYIKDNEKSIKEHLEDFMPSYVDKAMIAGFEIKKVLA